MKLPKSFFFIIIFIIIGLIIFIFIKVTNYYMNAPTITSIEKQNIDILTFLVVGLDNSSSIPRTDSIFVVMYNPKNGKVFLYNIPRDLRVRFQYQGQLIYDKINHVYSKRDIFALRSVVEALLGIKINNYCIVSYEAVSKIVDLIGGVQIYVDKDMKYTDNAQNLRINISKGLQTLDGEKALEYIRYRSDDEGDIGRIKRQINFVLKIMEQKDKLLNMKKIPNTIRIIYSKVKTDLTLLDFQYLAEQIKKISSDKFYYDVMPTKPLKIDNISYLVPLNVSGESYAQYLIKKIKSFLIEDKINYDSTITVEILNASPQKGLAKIIRDKLIQYGINVIYYGNSNFSSKVTRIIDRIGNIEKAQQIATILRTKNVETSINPSLAVDVTIIVGEDYNISVLDY
ncbi:MAG TPA: LCP family protein [Exilispira sp.]|mgnify:CR=1 FL=1|nr:LCP family protein [Exilispira sp.]